MIVLDTNVVSELMHPKGSHVVRQWVAAQSLTNLFTTTITQAEILYGIALLPSGKRQIELNLAGQYAELSTKIEQAVNNINQQPITYLINTHYHLDHTGGDVVIHIKDKNVIHTGDIYFQGMYPFIDTEVG